MTGAHRSGTTWVGRMLCRSHEAGYIHEPFNPARLPGWGAGRVPLWFVYVTSANEHVYAPLVERALGFRYPVLENIPQIRSPRRAVFYARDVADAVLARLRRARPLIKDPIALFSAGWLAERFGARVVVMIRHPAAFASSLKRLGWQFKFRGWLAQEALMRDLLHPFEQDIRRCAVDDVDIVEQAIVMWKAMHHVIAVYRRRHPEWTFLRHEDLAREPVEGFRCLYERLGLGWDADVEAEVKRHSGALNPGEVRRWRHGTVRRDSRATTRTWLHHLTSEETLRIRDGVEEVSPLFYSDADWSR